MKTFIIFTLLALSILQSSGSTVSVPEACKNYPWGNHFKSGNTSVKGPAGKPQKPCGDHLSLLPQKFEFEITLTPIQQSLTYLANFDSKQPKSQKNQFTVYQKGDTVYAYTMTKQIGLKITYGKRTTLKCKYDWPTLTIWDKDNEGNIQTLGPLSKSQKIAKGTMATFDILTYKVHSEEEGVHTIIHSMKMTDLNAKPAVAETKCVTLYSECNYKGDSIQLCEDNPDIKKLDQVKSIKVPKKFKKTVTLFDKKQYNGKKFETKTSVKCIEDDHFTFLSLGMSTVEKKTNLRGQNNNKDF